MEKNGMENNDTNTLFYDTMLALCKNARTNGHQCGLLVLMWIFLVITKIDIFFNTASIVCCVLKNKILALQFHYWHVLDLLL